MDSETFRIVQAALALRASHPHAPALDVLDLAMVGHHGADPDFDDPELPTGDHTDSRSPFGHLLRQAFMPSLAAEQPGEPAPQSWQHAVMQPFAERYGLWSTECRAGTDAQWVTVCATQILRRWPHQPHSDAEQVARGLAEQTAWRELPPEDAADGYVRLAEEQGVVPQERSAFQLKLEVAGASERELARGLSAAAAFFAGTTVTPARAVRGAFVRENWGELGFPEATRPPEADLGAARIWDEAHRAAVEACCASSPAQSTLGWLSLDWRR